MDAPCREIALERATASPTAEALEPLAREAWALRPQAPSERRGVMREEAGLLLDRLLTRVARGRGAVDVAIGEGLAALGEGDRALRLGFSGVGDYARERLGMSARTAQARARVARELRSRPLLRQAVRAGEVSLRQAETVLPVARGEAEAAWVARARQETVRALEKAVAAAGAAEPEPDERWELLCVPLSREGRATFEEAMELAGKLLGATAPRWQRLEALCQEYLGAHAERAERDGPVEDEVLHWPLRQWLAAAQDALEAETSWAFLDEVAPFAAPEGPAGDDPCRLDGGLRRLGELRDRWDEALGHLAMLVRQLGLWRDMKFASFQHYCSQRLGMSGRAVEQRIWLERRLYALPGLREAMREGRISYEKARLVAGCADERTVEAWMARAEGMTCLALQREVAAEEEAQMCARGELAWRVPARVVALLGEACRAVRAGEEVWLAPEECLARIARHFLDTWQEALAERSTPQHRALARDRGLCQVPGCSRAAAHAHHLVYRSRGGGDEPENLVSLCAAHHLHGVHRGLIAVRGRAPDRLRWEVRGGAGAAALA